MPSPAKKQCQHCGALFKAGRLACPECGSDARTGWRDAEDIDYLSVDIPDTYEEFTGKRPATRPLWTALIVILALLTGILLPLLWTLY